AIYHTFRCAAESTTHENALYTNLRCAARATTDHTRDILTTDYWHKNGLIPIRSYIASVHRPLSSCVAPGYFLPKFYLLCSLVICLLLFRTFFIFILLLGRSFSTRLLFFFP